MTSTNNSATPSLVVNNDSIVPAAKQTARVLSQTLRAVVQGAISHASTDTTRPHMNGLNIIVDDLGMAVQSTDGYRAFECVVTGLWSGSNKRKGFVMPLDLAKLLMNALKTAKPRKGQSDPVVELSVHAKPNGVSARKLTISCAEIGLDLTVPDRDERFPPVHKVFPATPAGITGASAVIGIHAAYLIDACMIFENAEYGNCKIATHGTALDPITVEGSIVDGLSARVVIMPVGL
jgi:hypothetical protein